MLVLLQVARNFPRVLNFHSPIHVGSRRALQCTSRVQASKEESYKSGREKYSCKKKSS
jgi:hypothetical protein